MDTMMIVVLETVHFLKTSFRGNREEKMYIQLLCFIYSFIHYI